MRNLAANLGLAGEHFDGDGVLPPIFMQHFDRVSSRAVDGCIHGASPIDAGPRPMSDPCHQLPSANLGFIPIPSGFPTGRIKTVLKKGKTGDLRYIFRGRRRTID